MDPSTGPVAEAPGDRITSELAAAREQSDDAVRAKVHAIVQARAAELADHFYALMLADPEGGKLLDHELVNSRLHASMRRWIEALFDPDEPVAALARTQRVTGEVHARIGVPMALVSRGARAIKRRLLAHLEESSIRRKQLLHAVHYIDEMLGAAVDGMGRAFTHNASRLLRSAEAYRLFFLDQDGKAERERRRSQLLEWAHQILERHYWNADDPDPMDLGTGARSAFELWLDHKASMLFDGAPELPLIHEDMRRVTLELVPRLSATRASRSDARPVVIEIRRAIDRIAELMVGMFDRRASAEDARDDVTLLLSRRYFPAIARREIALAQQQGTGLAVLMADIDRFGDVAQGLGSESVNRLLGRVAGALQEQLRAGDFLFRIGDDDFLALLVECDGASALRVAEGLRRSVEEMVLDLGGGRSVKLTISVGVVRFDGHPDYQRLLDRADEALRQAKAEGRNRCVSIR